MIRFVAAAARRDLADRERHLAAPVALDVPDRDRGFKQRESQDDANCAMIRSAPLVGFLLGLLSPAVAQERHASVRLEDGRQLEGRVLSMDLKELVIHVGDKVLLVPASEIRDCRFREIEAAPQEPTATAADQAASVEVAATPPVVAPPITTKVVAEQAPQGPSAGGDPAGSGTSADGAPARDPGVATSPVADGAAAPAPAGEMAPRSSMATSPSTAAGPSTATSDGPASAGRRTTIGARRTAAADVAPRPGGFAPYWGPRLADLDASYPWLRPGQPTQWISIGLVLLVGLGLIVHMSVRVAGAERAQLERSVGLGICYLISGLGQVAFVPVNDLSVTVMLLGNTTLALFCLGALFGLSRSGAMVALMIQLGFGALVLGILELTTSLLDTVGVTAGAA